MTQETHTGYRPRLPKPIKHIYTPELLQLNALIPHSLTSGDEVCEGLITHGVLLCLKKGRKEREQVKGSSQ